MDKAKTLKKTIHWGLAAVTIVLVVSGYGITEYRAVEAISFGIISKPLSFSLHTWLAAPFVLLLALHLYLTVFRKRKK